jgi:hypothetical protein
MTAPITLTAAMRDPDLLGAPFQAESFWTWFTVAKLIDGLPLDDREGELFRQCTGRSILSCAPVKNLTLLAGRRGGKDRFMSSVANYRAALACDWRSVISPGEQAVVLLIGTDRRQAKILRDYAEGLLQAPLLAQQVTRTTNDTIQFSNGGALEIVTGDHRLLRGRSAIGILGTEVSQWRDEMSVSSDEEILAAAEPSLAACPDGGLLILASSVYRRRGVCYRKWKQLHGNDAANDICWLASSLQMNPTLNQNLIDTALQDDPQRFGAEYLSEWREDLADFIPSDVIEECTDHGIRERAPLRGQRYYAFADAAGGTGQDSFALAICHVENDFLLVDAIRERKPRFVPADVIREFAVLLQSYHITQVCGDRFGGGFHSSEWAQHGITFTPCERTTSENYLATLPLLLSGRARLLDHVALRQQLTSLERRTHTSGRETVTHPPSQSSHDDVAAAVSGGLVTLATNASQFDDGRWFSDLSNFYHDEQALHRASAQDYWNRYRVW